MRKYIVLGLVLAMLVAGSFFVFAEIFTTTAAYAQNNKYRVDPKIRKGKARQAMMKAMELNAQVEMMIKQGSESAGKMMEMLSQSYGYQVAAIGEAEGLVREAKFKDPVLQQAIKEMYRYGKPGTINAESQIRNGNIHSALGSLAGAKRIHQKFMTLLY